MKHKQQNSISTNDYWQAVRLIENAYHSQDPNTFHAVDIHLDVTINIWAVGPEIAKLGDVYKLDAEDNIIAAALHHNGISVDDLLMVENDLRSFIPKKYLHPTAKFSLESAAWGMEGYDELRITLPTMVKYKDDDGELKESTYEILQETILTSVWHRVYPWEGQNQIYSAKSDKWYKIKFEYTWLDYEDEPKPATVKEFIHKGRAAGHDALGIANDPEAIEALYKADDSNK